MIQIKLYVNIKKIDKNVNDVRKNLFDFYDKLSNVENFDQINRNCFKQRFVQKIITIQIAKKTLKKKINTFIFISI